MTRQAGTTEQVACLRRLAGQLTRAALDLPAAAAHAEPEETEEILER